MHNRMTHFLRFGNRMCNDCSSSTQAFKPSSTLPQLQSSLSMVNQLKAMMTQKVIGKTKHEIDVVALRSSETDEFFKVITVNDEYSLVVTYDSKGGVDRDEPRLHIEFRNMSKPTWLTYSRHRWITCILRFFNGDQPWENDVYQCSTGEALKPNNGRLYMMDHNVTKIAVEVVITQRGETNPEENASSFMMQQIRLYQDGKRNGDLTLKVMTNPDSKFLKNPGTSSYSKMAKDAKDVSPPPGSVSDPNPNSNLEIEAERTSVSNEGDRNRNGVNRGNGINGQNEEEEESKENEMNDIPFDEEDKNQKNQIQNGRILSLSVGDDEEEEDGDGDEPGTRIQNGDDLSVVMIKTHSAVLRSASPVFQSMMKHHMREKNEMVIEIHGACSKDVDDMVFFILTNQLRWDADPLRIIQLAHLYDLPALIKVCAERISNEVHVHTFVDSFNVFNRYEIQNGFDKLVFFGKENMWILKQLDLLKELPFVFRFGILGARV